MSPARASELARSRTARNLQRRARMSRPGWLVLCGVLVACTYGWDDTATHPSTGGGASGTGASGGASGTGASGGASGTGATGAFGGSGGTSSGGVAGVGGGVGGNMGGSSGGPVGGGGGTDGCSCPSGSYCENPTCGPSDCVPLVSTGSTRDPVCGCNGVTYWNAELAALAHVAVKNAGECAATTSGCTCPPGTYCNQHRAALSQCGGAAAGTCWALPAACPTQKTEARACVSGSCSTECAQIKTGASWYTSSGC